MHEGLTVLADHAPDLSTALERAVAASHTHLNLDGTVLRTDRVAAPGPNGADLWWSGKHKHHGGNVRMGAREFVGVLLEVPALQGRGPVALDEQQPHTAGEQRLRLLEPCEHALADVGPGARSVLFAVVDHQAVPAGVEEDGTLRIP